MASARKADNVDIRSIDTRDDGKCRREQLTEAWNEFFGH